MVIDIKKVGKLKKEDLTNYKKTDEKLTSATKRLLENYGGRIYKNSAVYTHE